jgi:hypothetical protein
VLPVKGNLTGKRAHGMAYRLQGVDLGSGMSAPRVCWDHEAVTITADQALAAAAEAGGKAPDGDGSDLATAMKFIEEEFLVKERIESAALEEWAKNAGITKRTLERARKKLGVVSKRQGFGADGKFFLELPRSDP